MDDIADSVCKLIAETFSCDQLLVTRSTEAEDIDGWDSLSHAVLLLKIERHFGIRLDYSQVLGADNVGALIDCVARTMPSATA
jgi:acyl carrier protein